MNIKKLIVALQFLTRIKIVKNPSMDECSFAASVKFFPIVGSIVGIIMLALYMVLSNLNVSDHVMVAFIILTEFLLNGILLYDGYMDTADGVFSGRNRERMLDIMKDSCSGANAVVALAILIMVKYSVYMDMPPMYLAMSLLILPTLTLGLMTFNIRYYPYARPQGVGGMFVDANEPKATGAFIALACIGLLLYLGMLVDIMPNYLFVSLPIVITSIYNKFAADFLNNKLGGLTGDTYGFLVQSDSMVFLIVISILVNCNF